MTVAPGARVLVVDDDAPFATALRSWLVELGYEAKVATSAWETRAMLDDAQYEAVLLDLQLPDSRGHDLLRTLKEGNTRVPIIMMSGIAEMNDVVVAFREKAADFLKKPFSIDELSSSLLRVLKADDDGTGDEASCQQSTPAPAEDPNTGKNIRPAVAKLKEELRQGTATIPILDPNVAGLQRFLSAGEFQIDDVTQSVGRDCALTAAVLKAAQASSRTPITTLREACLRVGSRRVVGLALEVALQNQLSGYREPFSSILRNAWRNTQVTVYAAELLGRFLGRKDIDELRLAALLHNVGELLCLRLFADLYADVEVFPEKLAQEVDQLHQSFGLALTTSWGLAPSLIRIAGHHHNAEQLPEPKEQRRLRTIVLTAWQMALKAGYMYLPGQASPNLDPQQALSMLGLKAEDVAEMYQALKRFEF